MAWTHEYPAVATVEARTEEAMRVPIGVASPLWFMFGAAASAGEAVSTAIVDAISALDKAVQRGIIHKNQAARRKSRMMKLAKTTATASAAPKEAKPAKKTVRKK